MSTRDPIRNPSIDTEKGEQTAQACANAWFRQLTNCIAYNIQPCMIWSQHLLLPPFNTLKGQG
jgi:hypothetical protein